jgi:uncharacterized protein (TIGR03067 family)
MKPLLTAALVLLIPAAAPAADDKADIQGKWTAKVGPNEDVPIVVEFKDKAILVTVMADDNQEIKFEGEYKLDDAKNPKQIDLVNFTSPEGERTEDNLGIYELKGDELRICTGGPGQARPTEFLPHEEGGRGTVTLRREKKAD